MWGQVPTPTSVEIGGWMVAAAGVIGIAVLVLTLVEKWRTVFGKRAKDEEPITRADFEKHLRDSDEEHVEHDRKLREELSAIERKFQSVNGEIVNIRRKQLVMVQAFRDKMDEANKPILDKLDWVTKMVIRIAERLKISTEAETGDGR